MNGESGAAVLQPPVTAPTVPAAPAAPGGAGMPSPLPGSTEASVSISSTANTEQTAGKTGREVIPYSPPETSQHLAERTTVASAMIEKMGEVPPNYDGALAALEFSGDTPASKQNETTVDSSDGKPTEPVKDEQKPLEAAKNETSKDLRKVYSKTPEALKRDGSDYLPYQLKAFQEAQKYIAEMTQKGEAVNQNAIYAAAESQAMANYYKDQAAKQPDATAEKLYQKDLTQEQHASSIATPSSRSETSSNNTDQQPPADTAIPMPLGEENINKLKPEQATNEVEQIRKQYQAEIDRLKAQLQARSEQQQISAPVVLESNLDEIPESITEPVTEAIETPEKVVSPEMLQRQIEEMRILQENILDRQVRENAAKLKEIEGKSPQDREKAFLENPGLRELEQIALVRGIMPKDGITYPQENPLIIQRETPEGQRTDIRITRLTVRNGERVTAVQADGTTIEVTQQEITDRLLQTNGRELLRLASLSKTENARTLLTVKIAELEGSTINSERKNQIITDAAQEAGILTTDDIRAAMSNLAEETQKSSEVQTLLQNMSEKNLITSQDFTQALDQLGANPRSFDEEIGKLKIQRKEYTKAGNMPDAVRLIDQQLAIYQSAQKSVSKEGQKIFEKTFNAMQTGDIDVEKAKSLIKGFREGNLDEIINAVVIEHATSDEYKEEKAKKELKAKLLSSGLGAAAVLALLGFAFTSKIFKET